MNGIDNVTPTSYSNIPYHLQNSNPRWSLTRLPWTRLRASTPWKETSIVTERLLISLVDRRGFIYIIIAEYRWKPRRG